MRIRSRLNLGTEISPWCTNFIAVPTAAATHELVFAEMVRRGK